MLGPGIYSGDKWGNIEILFFRGAGISGYIVVIYGIDIWGYMGICRVQNACSSGAYRLLSGRRAGLAHYRQEIYPTLGNRAPTLALNSKPYVIYPL